MKNEKTKQKYRRSYSIDVKSAHKLARASFEMTERLVSKTVTRQDILDAQIEIMVTDRKYFEKVFAYIKKNKK